MLQPLLTAIATQLATDLPGIFPDSQPPGGEASAIKIPIITLGQPADSSDHPQIILRPGHLTLHSLGQSDSPPPRQIITIDPNNDKTSYPLNYPVNPATVTVFPLDPLDPPSEPPVEIAPLKKVEGFTLNARNQTLTLIPPLPNCKRLLVQFAANEISILQEFQQDVWIEIVASDPTIVDQLTTLTLTSLLTAQESLLAHNSDSPTPDPPLTNAYHTAQINANPSLRQLQLIQGDTPTSGLGFQLQFRVTGQVKLSRAVSDTPSVLSNIEFETTRLNTN